jgi:hypothetical protein
MEFIFRPLWFAIVFIVNPLTVVWTPPDVQIVTEGRDYSKPPELTTGTAISA